jgi:hypothetical protein
MNKKRKGSLITIAPLRFCFEPERRTTARAISTAD